MIKAMTATSATITKASGVIEVESEGVNIGVCVGLGCGRVGASVWDGIGVVGAGSSVGVGTGSITGVGVAIGAGVAAGFGALVGAVVGAAVGVGDGTGVDEGVGVGVGANDSTYNVCRTSATKLTARLSDSPHLFLNVGLSQL